MFDVLVHPLRQCSASDGRVNVILSGTWHELAPVSICATQVTWLWLESVCNFSFLPKEKSSLFILPKENVNMRFLVPTELCGDSEKATFFLPVTFGVGFYLSDFGSPKKDIFFFA